MQAAHAIASKPAGIKAQIVPRQRRSTQKLPPEELEHRRIAARLNAIQEAEQFENTRSFVVLAYALSDPDREVKDAALQALTEKNGTDVTQAIRRGLEDPDPEFRIEILEVLAEHGDFDSLRTATLDPDDGVRERAAELLESTGN
jgi:HEAT repeat protein